VHEGCAYQGCTGRPSTWLVLELCPDAVRLRVCDAHCAEAQAIAKRYHAVAYRLIAMGHYERPVDWMGTAVPARRLPA